MPQTSFLARITRAPSQVIHSITQICNLRRVKHATIPNSSDTSMIDDERAVFGKIACQLGHKTDSSLLSILCIDAPAASESAFAVRGKDRGQGTSCSTSRHNCSSIRSAHPPQSPLQWQFQTHAEEWMSPSLSNGPRFVRPAAPVSHLLRKMVTGFASGSSGADFNCFHLIRLGKSA